jgi:predicted acylesterase/phospholipase RssA
MTQHIGVAMSGGGHRASAWALGTMFYLVHAGKHAELAAISSVSGGSITNGVLAHEFPDLRSADDDQFAGRVQHLVRNVADVGLFFWGPRTNRYVLVTLALAIVTGAGLLTTIVWTAITGLRLGALICLIVTAVLAVIATALFEQRSVKADRALAAEHFSTNGAATLLADVDRPVSHVFCATELQEGRHFYMSPKFVYSWANGVGDPASLPLSTAVQASACLPGAFAARRLPTAPHAFRGGAAGIPSHDDLVLADGGVYDNMGEQWLRGLSNRVSQVDGLPPQLPVDQVLVVNASALPGWHLVGPKWPAVAREVSDLLADKDVMYLQTTSTRRADMVAAWEANEMLGTGVRGVLVHIAQDPHVAVTRMTHEPLPRPTGDPATDQRLAAGHQARVGRAQAALAKLNAVNANWSAIARMNTGVPTVLRKLGRKDTVRLLYGSYVVAMCMAHVELAYPLYDLPDPNIFAKLIAGNYTVTVSDLAAG